MKNNKKRKTRLLFDMHVSANIDPNPILKSGFLT
jgi:hypothetical protein